MMVVRWNWRVRGREGLKEWSRNKRGGEECSGVWLVQSGYIRGAPSTEYFPVLLENRVNGRE